MSTPANKPQPVRRWLDRLVRRIPQRKVLLVMFDGRLRIAKAYPSESGWMAQWIGDTNQWSLLLPDGNVKGTNLVKGWMPHTGWQDQSPNAPASSTEGRP